MKKFKWQHDLQQIRHFRLFHDVAADSLEQVFKAFRACELRRGEVLLSPFSRNRYLYLLLEGRLNVYLGSLDNPIVSTLDAGDCAGEISFVDNDHPCAYVVAAEPSRVLRLHREALITLFSQSPQLMQNLLELLCERVRQGNQLILDKEQHANLDSLTGVFNRRWLEHAFERESSRCRLNGQPLSLLMLDVDHFKQYNDQHGHLAGDYALRLVARTLSEQLRLKDILVRYGGEEFVVLLPESADDEDRNIGERLRQSLEQIGTFYSPLGMQPGVTVSIGLAKLGPHDTLQDLIARADSALYQAKQRGRNCLCD